MGRVFVRAAFAALVVAVAGGALGAWLVSAATQQPPVFRAGVRLVRVDVTVTGKADQPVGDLAATDFEVAEDGTPQRVEQVQFVRLDGRRPSGDERSLEIRSQEQGEAEAARDDVRLFAIFLDDYHLDKAPGITIPLRRALSTFVERLWPTDLVVMMDPLTPLSALRLTRSRSELLDVIHNFEGRQGQLFPVKSVMEEAQWSSGDVSRLRAEVTLSALTALTVKLGGLREGRKVILFVSQGPPAYFGSRGGDTQLQMRELAEAANRNNVTIYAVDPAGLGANERAGARATLYQLASETGGRAIVNVNSLDGGLARILNDTSAYYVLGYMPTRTEDDGKYHKIDVKVRRPGMRVLARQGYWAPSRQEVEAANGAASTPLPPGVAGALMGLTRSAPRRTPLDVWVGLSKGADGHTSTTVTWEPSGGVSASHVAGLDVEFLPAGGGSPIEPARTLPAVAPGRPEQPHEVFALSPGERVLRLTARTEDGSVVDRWEQPITVLDFTSTTLGLATARFFRARSAANLREILAAPDAVPVAGRLFRRTDRVLVSVECYTTPGATGLEMNAHVLTQDGQDLTALPLAPPEGGLLRFELPVSSFGQGTYILRVRASLGVTQTEQLTAFRVVP